MDIMKNYEEDRDAKKEEYEAANDAWWESLSYEEKEHAMYAISKRIFQGSVLDQGSYRHTMYDIMGLEGTSYEKGMDCGLFAIHNSVTVD